MSWGIWKITSFEARKPHTQQGYFEAKTSRIFIFCTFFSKTIQSTLQWIFTSSLKMDHIKNINRYITSRPWFFEILCLHITPWPHWSQRPRLKGLEFTTNIFVSSKMQRRQALIFWLIFEDILLFTNWWMKTFLGSSQKFSWASDTGGETYD